MAKKAEDAPWFKFFVADWLLSERMVEISFESKGIYIDLLVQQWRQLNSLPSSHLTLQKMIFCDPETWERSGRIVVETFFEPNEAGRLFNPKLSAIWNDMEDRHLVNVENGRKGGKARVAQAKLKPKSSQAVAKVKQGSSIKEVEVEVEVEVEAEGEKEKATAASPPSADTAFSRMQREIFDYFKEKTGKSPKHYTLGAKRFAAMLAISTEIADRAPENEEPEFYVKRVWKHAIDRLAASDWHMGRDPKTNGKTFNDIMVLATNIEAFEKFLN